MTTTKIQRPYIVGKKYRAKKPVPLGRVYRIVLHYSATYPDVDHNAQTIDKMHREQRGFACIGYHFVIRRDGIIEFGRDLRDQGAHVRGFNPGSIGICCIGGIDRETGPDIGVDNRTDAQKMSTIRLVKWLKAVYDIEDTHVLGHRDLVPTQCPGFDVRRWWPMAFRSYEMEHFGHEIDSPPKPNPPIQVHTDIRPTKPPIPVHDAAPAKKGSSENWFTRFIKKLIRAEF